MMIVLAMLDVGVGVGNNVGVGVINNFKMRRQKQQVEPLSLQSPE